MSEQTREDWGDYSKLVLRELERLNDNYENLRKDFESKLQDISSKLAESKNVEKNVDIHKAWIDKVNDVWSPSQMKEAKDEIYKQKTKWAATIAILSFVQILMGIILVFFKNFVK